MKILFVHEVSYESKVVFEMHELPELLAKKGHSVTFVDFPEGDSLWPPRLRARERRVAGRAHADVMIRVISMARWFPYPLDRLVCAFRSIASMSIILRQERPDVVVCYSVPTNGWQTVAAARRAGIPVVFRAIDVSHELRKTIFRPLIRIAERFVYRKSNLVLANNQALAEYCIEHGAQRERCNAIFPGTTELPAPSSAGNKNDGWANVIFMGTLFRFCGLGWFLQSLASNQEAREIVRLDVLGDGEDREGLEKLVDDLGLHENVRFLGRVPFESLRERMSQAKVGILPFDESLVTRLALPGKVPQYVQVGLATVSTHLDGLKHLFPDSCGVTYQSRGSKFVTEVLNLLNSESERHALVRRGQYRMAEVSNWDGALQSFEDALLQVVEHPC